jgi:hypothetical protein
MPWISRSDTYLEVAKAAIEEDIDLVIIETDTWENEFASEYFTSYYNNLIQIREFTESLGKTFMLILPQYPGKHRERYKNKLINDDFMVFPSVRRAGKAFLALHDYGEKLQALKNK